MKKLIGYFRCAALYALFALNANAADCIITLNKNSGTGLVKPGGTTGTADDTITCACGEPCQLPKWQSGFAVYADNPVENSATTDKRNKLFSGWCWTADTKNADGTACGWNHNGDNYTFTESRTMYARWSSCCSSAECTAGTCMSGTSDGSANCVITVENNACRTTDSQCKPGYHTLNLNGNYSNYPTCAKCPEDRPKSLAGALSEAQCTALGPDDCTKYQRLVNGACVARKKISITNLPKSAEECFGKLDTADFRDCINSYAAL